VAGISLVCGVSAASSLAVDLAAEFGMTVVGFLRGGGFTIYTDQGRVAGVEA
jgi:FdhD protein